MLIIASASRWVETHMAVGNAGWLQPLQLQAEARIAMQAADHGLSPCPVSGHATGKASMARWRVAGCQTTYGDGTNFCATTEG